jgi:hypothetical protein
MNCKTCGRPLNDPANPLSADCGGDCLRCMAEAGDPEAKASVQQIMSTMLAINQQAAGGSRWVEYDGMMVMVPLQHIRDAMAYFSKRHPTVRRGAMESVKASIARLSPGVKAGTASHEDSMGCCQDIAIWFANEVIEGRATLEVS